MSVHRLMRMVVMVMGGIGIVLAVSACLPLFTDELLIQVGDETSPTVTITSPADGSSYAAVVLVDGIVSDTTGEAGGVGLATSVTYELLSTSIAGTTTVADDGTFSFDFETTGLSGSITVRISVIDWNGNVQEVFLNLVNEGAIPSFTVVPGNGAVTMEWDDVPLATSYTVRYTDTGRIPSETVGIVIADASSPLSVSGLENGGEFSFLLEAVHNGGTSSWSAIQSAIPLSEFTLIPRIEEEYAKLTLRWNTIEGADKFEILRATSADGPFAVITGAREGTEFVDLEVTPGTRYYYSVRPAHESGIASHPVGAAPTRFPTVPLDLLATQLSVFEGAWSMAIEGDYAYVGVFGAFFSGWADLHIYDISTPSSPQLIGEARFSSGISGVSNPNGIQIVGTTAYLTSNENRVHAIDISDPAAPFETLEVTGYTKTMGIAVDAGVGYVADFSGGVQKIDLGTLAITQTYATAGNANDIVIRDGHAFVASGAAGLEIFNLASMLPVDLVDLGATTATSVTLDGNYAYVSLGLDGMSIVDVETIGSSAALGTVDTAGDAIHVEIVGGRAYVSNSDSGLAIIDVGSPGSPQLVASENRVDYTDQTAARDGYLFVAGRSLSPLNVFRINEFPQVSQSQLLVPTSGSVFGVSDNFVGTGASGDPDLNIYDRSTGGSIDTIPMSADHQVAAAAIHADHLFYTSINNVSFDAGRLDVARLDEVAGVVGLGSLLIENLIFSLVIDGDYAYVGGYNVLYVVDVSDPANMAVIGFTAVPDLIYALTKAGNYIYAVTSDLLSTTNTVIAVDVTFPERPELIDSLSLPGLAVGNWIGVHDGAAFIGTSSESAGDLQVVDITTPSALAFGAFINLGGNDPAEVYNVAIQGSFLYAATATTLDVVDIFDAAAPIVISSSAISVDSPIHVWGDEVVFSVGNDVWEYSLTVP